jgi:hypothetical protein
MREYGIIMSKNIIYVPDSGELENLVPHIIPLATLHSIPLMKALSSTLVMRKCNHIPGSHG